MSTANSIFELSQRVALAANVLEKLKDVINRNGGEATEGNNRLCASVIAAGICKNVTGIPSPGDATAIGETAAAIFDAIKNHLPGE